MSTISNSDYSDLLFVFCANHVEFLLVGAHALALHGYPRFSEDLDVWVRPTVENAERVYAALAQFGAPLENIAPADFTSPDLVLQIGIAPVRIDILTSISGVTWDEGWQSRIAFAYGGVTSYAIGRDALIRNKRASGRPKDLLDIEALERG